MVTIVLITEIEMFTPIVLLDRAKQLLAKAEWSQDGHCPWCDNYRLRGHTADCPYAQFKIENANGLDIITKGDYGGLTEREFEVLTKMAQGMMNDEIAVCLEISPQTVKNHISSIFTKLNVTNRTQAVTYSLNRGWMCQTKPDD